MLSILRIASALPAFAVAMIIFMLSAKSELPTTAFSFPYADKLLHAGAYGLLALAIHIALPKGPVRNNSFVLAANTSRGASLRKLEIQGVLLRFRASPLGRLVAQTRSTYFAPGPKNWRWRALVAVAIASAYGITDELHQLKVPGRSCDVWDWVADTAGAALAMLALRFWRGKTTPSAAVQSLGDAPDDGDRDIDNERPKRRHDQHAAEL